MKKVIRSLSKKYNKHTKPNIINIEFDNSYENLIEDNPKDIFIYLKQNLLHEHFRKFYFL